MAVEAAQIRIGLDSLVVDADAGGELSLGDVVYMSGSGLLRADNRSAQSANVLGIVVSGMSPTPDTTFSAGDRVTIARNGKVYGFSGLTPGAVLYLGMDGQMVSTKPSTGNVRQVAVALSDMDILLTPGDEPGIGGGGTGFSLDDMVFATNWHSSVESPIERVSDLNGVLRGLRNNSYLAVKRFSENTVFFNIDFYTSSGNLDSGDVICNLPQTVRPSQDTWYKMLFSGYGRSGDWLPVHVASDGDLRIYGSLFAVRVAGFASLVVAGAFVVPPGRPQNLVVATGADPGTMDLSWDPPASNGGQMLSGYNVYTTSPVPDFVTGTTFHATGFTPGQRDSVQVAAVNADAGEGSRITEFGTAGS